MSEDEAGRSGTDAEHGLDADAGADAGTDAGTIGDTAPESASEWTREWLEARAAEQDVTPGELLKRFAAAFRAAEEGDIPNLAYRDDVEALDDELEALSSELDGIERSVDDLDDDVGTKIQDVRERVIQVKREVDTKAPADHTHPEFDERVASLEATVADTQDRLTELLETFDALDATVDDGFENFEEILEYLTEVVDDVEARSNQLASAVVSTRETLQGIAVREGRRSATDRLREQANEHGIRTADCGDCGADLDVALLTDARCPHCKSTFASVEPKRGFFGSPTLEIGDRPALEAGDVAAPDAPQSSADASAMADGNGQSPVGHDLDAIRDAIHGTADDSEDAGERSEGADR